MVRVQDKSDRDYNTVRDIILDELSIKETKGSYRAVLDYILCELDVREGNVSNAIDSFNKKTELYQGTSMEVEMLARISELHGNELGNRDKAKEYADRAASINPGQLALYSAYEAAGIDYNPTLYEDKFAGKIENFDVQPEPIDKPVTEEITQFVSITPNPVNPTTTITYSIAEPSNVKLVIYSVSGQKVATLVDGHMTAGKHAATFDGSNLASGVYFYSFESKGFTKTGKMLLIK